ncbi:cell division inhibitor SepF [Allocatelliglobosispora scoriae]|uniref:Cell division protein SepF n=1 Tax=Allocatelliglobosispora scoriae TaxID=643052 RepID=A0A841BR14_9ACTN|nr:cell division protein SepF [Allocatelliglobosispora scoriae]MBB5869363.1 cell division inhibitor SepF [Allocatelliglobosispora scoriae]
MSALRKAGVWLGLVEDDDDREYDDRRYSAASTRERSSYRDSRRDSRYADARVADDFDDEDDEDDLPVVPRTRYSDRSRPDLGRADSAGRGDLGRGESARADASRSETSRYDEPRSDRSTVRPITRSTGSAGSGSGGASAFPTRDNLALSPQPTAAPRSAMAPKQEERRYQITTLHPTTYNEARTIGEHFRDGTPVIMNLTEMDEADAKRLVDFAAGLAFGLRGTIERVTHRVFLLSPANVQVTAEEKAKIAEGGYTGQG